MDTSVGRTAALRLTVIRGYDAPSPLIPGGTNRLRDVTRAAATFTALRNGLRRGVSPTRSCQPGLLADPVRSRPSTGAAPPRWPLSTTGRSLGRRRRGERAEERPGPIRRPQSSGASREPPARP